MRSRPAILAALAAVVALAGCGGDDDAASSATASPTVEQPAATAPATTSAPATTTASGTNPDSSASASGDASGGPNATLSPQLPDELAGEVGPLEVQGTALPPLGDNEVSTDPALGLTAPILIGQDFDGNTVRVDPAADGPTLAVFLAHWCPHCNREVPRINELRDAGRFPSDLDIVGISTGINPGRPNWPPSKWFKDMDWTYPVIADGVDMDKGTFIGADAYGVDAFPFMVLIDGDGKVVGRWSGEREPDEVIKLITDNLPAG